MSEQCKKHPHALMMDVDCGRCGGEGVLDDMDDWEGRGETCYRCRGSGLEPWRDCEDCMLDEQYEEELSNLSESGSEK